ncbi:MAG: MYG1 family protein [Patescibacteria group bacterium]
MSKIVTHSGAFHADDVMSGAVLKTLFPYLEVVRTRDENVLKAALADKDTIVFDVGGECNADTHNFDHHQKGGGGTRKNGVPLSSFGLIWRRFGIEFCTRVIAVQTIDTDVHPQVLMNEIDTELVQGVDAIDAGAVDDPRFRPAIGPHMHDTCVEVQTISGVLFDLNPHKLLGATDEDFDVAYGAAVEIASAYLRSFCLTQLARLHGKRLIEQGRRIEDQIVVATAVVPDWSDVVSGPDGFEETMFYLDPDGSDPTGQAYMIWQVPTEPRGFAGRKPLPESWAGLRGNALVAQTGIEGANFCHGGRFVGGGKTLEAAIAMAKAAIKA